MAIRKTNKTSKEKTRRKKVTKKSTNKISKQNTQTNKITYLVLLAIAVIVVVLVVQPRGMNDDSKQAAVAYINNELV